MYHFGLKERKKMHFLINAPFDWFSLAMYPSDHFFLKALFLRATSAGPGGVWLKGISIRLLGPLGLDSELLGPPGLVSCLRRPPGLHFGRLGHPVPIFAPRVSWARFSPRRASWDPEPLGASWDLPSY